jgi:para-aminobenzoate synthetase/4-amino-4-deoxychorismate lyase
MNDTVSKRESSMRIEPLRARSKKAFAAIDVPGTQNRPARVLLFRDFEEILVCTVETGPGRFFRALEQRLDRGRWACGFFAYEFGELLEPAAKKKTRDPKIELAWMGISEKAPRSIDEKEWNFRTFAEWIGPGAPETADGSTPVLGTLSPSLDRDEYRRNIRRIRRFLERGWTYQVNYTFKVRFPFRGSVPRWYFQLRRSQPADCSALIFTGDAWIVSLSPELFFSAGRGRIVCKPMKGTAPRGRDLVEDRANRRWLKNDVKNRAENVMIVDLVRNDLGKIARRVEVPALFDVETYRTLLQMTSTVRGTLKPGVGWEEVFRALYPSGSVTGAPKIRTMNLIRRLEKESRGVYTGAVGYFGPKRSARFNVAIRTAVIRGRRGEMGIGSGVVYDSVDHGEFEECLMKARFLEEDFSGFSVVETLRWDRGRGYRYRKLHEKRLVRSCRYFRIPLDVKRYRFELRQCALRLAEKAEKAFRVRVTVDLSGTVRSTFAALRPAARPVKIRLSPFPVDADDPGLYFKTTRRKRYEMERERALNDGFFETVFVNARGELTEGTVTNLFVQRNGILYTPPVRCGLLPGVLRESLIARKKVREGMLFPRDLEKAERIFVGNSVRGLLRAGFVREPGRSVDPAHGGFEGPAERPV